MRKQLVALTLSAAMAAGMLSGCGGYGSGSGGQKDAAEAAGTAAAAASTAAAGSDGTAEPAKASTADGEPILIGALYPMTGALADSGQNMKDGIDLAVEEINAAGGISGRPIQIVYGDTQGANATGMTEMERNGRISERCYRGGVPGGGKLPGAHDNSQCHVGFPYISRI